MSSPPPVGKKTEDELYHKFGAIKGRASNLPGYRSCNWAPTCSWEPGVKADRRVEGSNTSCHCPGDVAAPQTPCRLPCIGQQQQGFQAEQ
jgi:hypothetical protein